MKRLVAWVKKYERRLGYGALTLGFIIDSLTLRRIDLLPENLVIIGYLVLILAAIVLMHLDAGRYHRFGIIPRIAPFLPLLMQFAFGSLFSGFVVFYSRSAAVGASWPFLLVLILLLIGNESFRGRYERLNFRLGLFFFGFLTYAVFALPVALRQIGDRVFIASLMISLLVAAGIIEALRKIARDIIESERRKLYAIVSTITVLFSVAYFYNIIPPVPLILKSAGVAHRVSRTSPGVYQARIEEKPKFHIGASVFHRHAGEAAYVWSTIFAPTELTTSIMHEWQTKDDSGSWQTVQTIPMMISGGRDEGFRAYSYRSALPSGEWRTNIKTKKGQLLGRVHFTVQDTDNPPLLETISL